MGMLDAFIPKMTPSETVEVPPFVPSDKSGLTDREIAEAILEKLERAEHMALAFSAQAASSPLLASFVPKLA